MLAYANSMPACSDFILRNAFQVTEFGFHKQWCWTFFVSRRSPDCDWHFLFSHVIFCSCFFNAHSIASFSHLSILWFANVCDRGMQQMNICIFLFGDILGTITPKKINKKATKQNKRVEEVAVSTVGLVDLGSYQNWLAAARWLWNSKLFGGGWCNFFRNHEHVLDLWGTLKPMGNVSEFPWPKTLPRRSWWMR